MGWVTDQYQLLNSNQAALRISREMLQVYPLTRACLEILGVNLLNKLEAGFFLEGKEIIRQGEEGKDLFLICTGKIDVVVNDQVVVQMEPPTLLGDKALVEPKSIRSATIRIAKEQKALVMKIPMGIFIRNFNDTSIPDKNFSQEVEIFANLFHGIQKRLFEYIYLQKNLWEEVSTTLNLINTQAIAKAIDNKRELHWDETSWKIVLKFLETELKFSWPANIPLNQINFREVLFKLLDRKFPQENYKGTRADYLSKKHLLWRTWLTRLGDFVSKSIPAEKRPYNADMELFNPRNYILRMNKLLNQLNSRFPRKSSKNILGDTPKGKNLPSTENFFGKGERSHEFDLKKYLNFLDQTFELKHPNRMSAQVAQRIALIAAQCENQFNASVAKMQQFLEKTQNKVAAAPTRKQDLMQIASSQLLKYIFVVLKSFDNYNRQFNLTAESHTGEVRYIPGLIPNIDGLIKFCGLKSTRAELDNAYRQIIEAFNIREKLLPWNFVRHHFRLFEIYWKSKIPFSELKKHYWIPVSENICLMYGDDNLGPIKQGRLIGGNGWAQALQSEEDSNKFYLKMPDEPLEGHADRGFLILVIPQGEFPWESDKNPDFELFINDYVPMMQWVVNKQIQHIHYAKEQRDIAFQNWFEIEQIIRVDQQVKAFESIHGRLPPAQHNYALQFLKNTIGLELYPKKPIFSDILAKKIYNHILHQMNADYPELSAEERGNKVYTKWRFILSEIIQAFERLHQQESQTDDTSPKPVWEILTTEMGSIIETYLDIKGEEYINLNDYQPNIDIIGLMEKEGMRSSKMKIMLYQLLKVVFETNLCRLMLEMQDYKDRLQKIKQLRPQTETETIQLEIIKEQARKLEQQLSNPQK